VGGGLNPSSLIEVFAYAAGQNHMTGAFLQYMKCKPKPQNGLDSRESSVKSNTYKCHVSMMFDAERKTIKLNCYSFLSHSV